MCVLLPYFFLIVKNNAVSFRLSGILSCAPLGVPWCTEVTQGGLWARLERLRRGWVESSPGQNLHAGPSAAAKMAPRPGEAAPLHSLRGGGGTASLTQQKRAPERATGEDAAARPQGALWRGVTEEEPQTPQAGIP